MREQSCRLKEIDCKMRLEWGNSIKHVAVWLIWDSSHRDSNTVEDLACQSTSYLFPLKRISLFCARRCSQYLWGLQNQAASPIFVSSIAPQDMRKYRHFRKSSKKNPKQTQTNHLSGGRKHSTPCFHPVQERNLFLQEKKKPLVHPLPPSQIKNKKNM